MSQLGVRTIYGQEDLKRASQASGKIVGMYESMKGLDSGLGGEVEDGELESLGDVPPVPPKLINPEQQDSGIGGEEVETDRAVVETQTASAIQQDQALDVEVDQMSSRALQKPLVGRSAAVVVEKPIPRRPRKTIVPGRSTRLQYSPPRQATEETAAVPGLSRINAAPEQAVSEVQRLHLQNQWQQILFQQQINYLLPNRDGDT